MISVQSIRLYDVSGDTVAPWDVTQEHAAAISSVLGVEVEAASNTYYIYPGGVTSFALPHIGIHLNQAQAAYEIELSDSRTETVLSHQTVSESPTLYFAASGSRILIGLGTVEKASFLDILIDTAKKFFLYIPDAGTGIIAVNAATAESQTVPAPGFVGHENWLSLAPLLVPGLTLPAGALDGLYAPAFMRASKEYQQFSAENTDYLASGNPLSATGAQFVLSRKGA